MDESFEPVLTEDGSSSLRNLRTGEPMHSLQGAFSESLAISIAALKRSLSLARAPSILSVGLGLAYNEIMSIAFLKRSGIKDFRIVSFEKSALLTKDLLNWIETDRTGGRPYEDIVRRSADFFGLSEEELKREIEEAIRLKKWVIRPALEPETNFGKKFHCLFFDAFSEDTDPELWDETHLENLISKACAKSCVFSTYAAKAVLTRVLKKAGFTLEKRPGFGKKRESTLALRV
ncbi:MAG: MnmC family methyltransferase [Bacteriovoracales bacterium]|nr:MnmC family methyltransferase [Bacteriovoracales bacterium]